MLKIVTIFCICLTVFPAFCQSASKYQVGTITEVKVHQTSEAVGTSDAVNYDVSIQVGDTIYVVLYTPPLREGTAKYAAGREVLVLVGKSTIRYNDLLGQAYDAPIESRRPAPNAKGVKPASGAQ
jgi:hypothetical protein